MCMHIGNFEISLSWEYSGVIFLVLGLAVAIDILLKWQAFGRIESIAIHISSFSTLYCLIKSIQGKGDYFGIKFIISLVVLLALTALHTFLKLRIHTEIDNVFDDLSEKTTDETLKSKILAQKIIATYAIDIALSKKRMGKLDRRRRTIKSLREMGFDPGGNILDEDTFLLAKAWRIFMIFLFAILGSISVIIPIIEIIKKAP